MMRPHLIQLMHDHGPTGLGEEFNCNDHPVRDVPFAGRGIAQGNKKLGNWDLLRTPVLTDVARAAVPEPFVFKHLVMIQIQAFEDCLARS